MSYRQEDFERVAADRENGQVYMKDEPIVREALRIAAAIVAMEANRRPFLVNARVIESLIYDPT